MEPRLSTIAPWHAAGVRWAPRVLLRVLLIAGLLVMHAFGDPAAFAGSSAPAGGPATAMLDGAHHSPSSAATAGIRAVGDPPAGAGGSGGGHGCVACQVIGGMSALVGACAIALLAVLWFLPARTGRSLLRLPRAAGPDPRVFSATRWSVPPCGPDLLELSICRT